MPSLPEGYHKALIMETIFELGLLSCLWYQIWCKNANGDELLCYFLFVTYVL